MGRRLGPDQDARRVAQVRARLADLGSPERAVQEKRYLKSPMLHFGVRVPIVRKTVQTWWKEIERQAKSDGAAPTASEVLVTSDLLWDDDVYEMREASIELLRFRVAMLGPDHLGVCESRIRESFTWALVDSISTDIVGRIVGRPGADELCGPVLDQWSHDQNFWLRRAAMLSQLPTVRLLDGDASRFLRYADEMLDEKEFFIRKAIGWILREMSRKRPDAVFDWLEPRVTRASGVTFREAVKYLSTQQGEKLRELRSVPA
ncbi:MAG: DNA alkylation repair protein [Actinomycetes bacterium]